MSAGGTRVISLAEARAARAAAELAERPAAGPATRPATWPATPAAAGRVVHPPPDPALEGLAVFERGWLSSNNVLIHDPAGAVLVDSGHCLHGDQTVALVRQALERSGQTLSAVLNTHLHSDHCGGNAALARAFGEVPVFVPASTWEAVQAWDDARLSYAPTGQRMERFRAAGTLQAGERLRLGGRDWEVIAAPGHDPDSVVLFDHSHGVLISADALWENGFGVVFPELDGLEAFDDVGRVLDRLEALPATWVIPGHGAPFQDLPGALARARRRLAGLQSDPARHRLYAAKVLLKHHLLEEQRQSVARLHLWAGQTPLLRRIWVDLDCPRASVHAWCDELLDELVRRGAARREGDLAINV